MDKRTLTLLGCGLALILFFAINITANATLRSWRADLTEDKVYTLDEGSKAIAKKVDEPINLYFYFSRNVARNLPQLTEYADRVLSVLREYERASSGNIRLSVVDPEPFSVQEDQAVERGVQGVQATPGGDPIYFGLVGTGSTDAKEVIPFFALEEPKQRELEYDLSKLIWSLANPDKKKVGILSALALEGGGGNPMMGQQGEQRWPILDELGDFFNVQVLPGSTEKLADDLDILVVIHPRGFTDATLYLVDQWALAGKPLVVFADPQCEVDPGESSDPSNPMARFTAEKGSNPEKLFKAWGLQMVKSKVACDRITAVRQPAQSRDRRSQVEIPWVHVLRLGKDQVSQEDPVTRQLDNLILWTPGSLRKLSEGTTTFAPLLQTSEESQEVDSTQFQFQADAQQLLASFVPGYEKLTLAARVGGNAQTAFPDGKPGAPPPPTEGADKPAEASAGESLKASTKPLDVIVVSDVDLLHERLWLHVINIAGARIPQLISQNADFLKNAIDSVAGGQELMSIRMRGKTSRPFERVQEIQRAADERFLSEQRELERKLQDAEQRLGELQKKKADGSEELVTAEQRKEEDAVREEFVRTRGALRDVKHKLRKDIESLGTLLKVLNIGLVPFLVFLAALGSGSWRIRQRDRK